MTSKEVTAALGTPEILKLKQIGSGLAIDLVLGDRVLVETVEPETQASKLERQGLIYTPATVKDKVTPRPSTGIILQVGSGVAPEDEQWLKVGAMVLFSKYAGMDVIVDEREGLKLLETREVACVLKATDAIIAPIAREIPI